MMKRISSPIRLTLIGTCALLIGAVACDRDNDLEEVEVTNAAQPAEQTAQPATNTAMDDYEADDDMQNDEAAEQNAPMTGKPAEKIAQARCEREQRCGNVGAGKEYSSMSACVQKTSADWRDDLNAYECPEGVVDKELSECLEEVRNEDCENPFDKLGSVVACRAGDICNGPA